MNNDTSTERMILTAARTVFHRYGYEGARMQEIANEAGINKALLHYYFRSKDKLFEAVFQEALKTNFLPVLRVLTTPLPLEKKITTFVEGYIDTLLEHPYIPAFVLHELNRNPTRLVHFVSQNNALQPPVLLQQIQDGIDSGRYNPINPKQLLAHLIGMVIFPFVAAPMLKFALQLSDEEYIQFIRARKKEVPDALFKILIK